MKFSIKPNPQENLIVLMRKLGYHFLKEKESESSFIKVLAKSGYPRFHIYLKEDRNKKEVIFNLHLDQKKPIYKNVRAHSGEHEGRIVKEEAERIKNNLNQ